MHRLGKLAAGSVLALPAAAAGLAAAAGVAEIPVPIHAGPAVAADARLQTADYSSLTYGPTIGLPKVHETFLGINVGINVAIKELDTHVKTNQRQTLAALAKDPRGIIGPAIRQGMQQRGGEALAAGLGVFAGLETARRRLRRRHRAQTAQTREELELLCSILSESAEGTLSEATAAKTRSTQARLREQVQKQELHRRRHKLAAAAAGLGMFAVSGMAINHEIGSLRPAPSTHTVIFPAGSADPLASEILADNPVLAGAFVTGDAGYYARQGVIKIAGDMEQADAYWRGQAAYLTGTALPRFRAAGGMAWQQNPDIIAFAQVSDIHDNRPELEYFLQPVLEAASVDFVVNTGDEMNYSHQLFLDNGAWQRFAAALPKTDRHGEPLQAIVIAGNHDEKDSRPAHDLSFKTSDGKTYHPLLPLDKSSKYLTTIDGITFVGAPDDNRTATNGTKPSDYAGQMANDAKQGKVIADAACGYYEETGQKPIALAHERQATYEAIARGCVKLALSGHTHNLSPVEAYLNADGSVAYRQTLGSSSGDGPNNVAAIYNQATKVGTISIWLYNTATDEFLQHNIMIYINPSGNPSIGAEPLPVPARAVVASSNTAMQRFFTGNDVKFTSQRQTIAAKSRNILNVKPRLPSQYRRLAPAHRYK